MQEDTPDGWWTWRDILEYAGMCGSDFPIEAAERRKSVPGLTESLSRLMDGEVSRSLDRRLKGRYSENDILYIWCNIEFIMEYRSTFGRALPFIERLIELYRLGGYPCGWDGIHPEGRLVVYFPPEETASGARFSTGGEDEETGADEEETGRQRMILRRGQ